MWVGRGCHMNCVPQLALEMSRVFPGSKQGGGGTILIMCTHMHVYCAFNWLKQTGLTRNVFKEF